MLPVRDADTLSSAYSSLHSGRFFVGYIGAMAGISWLIFLKLVLIVFGVYAYRVTGAVATVELFLLSGMVIEASLVVKAAISARIALIETTKFRPFFADLVIIGFGAIFVFLHACTNFGFIVFLFNFIWITLLTGRCTFYFRIAWRAAQDKNPSTGHEPVPVILVGGKPLLTGPV